MNLCFIAGHVWTKWCRPMNSYTAKKVQYRECTRCGQAQHRHLGYDEQVVLKDVSSGLDSVSEGNK